jgi:hypothetical protein
MRLALPHLKCELAELAFGLCATAKMFRGAFRRHVGMAATFATAGALARASCDSAPPVGLAEQRRATVVHRPGSGVHTSPLTLEYFALRGLGELPRLILEASGLPYDCVFHYLEGDWKPRAAFGQLPVLHDGDLTISQSRAIVRYLARKACIDGATEAEKAQVDMWCEFHRDLNDKKSAVHFLPASRPSRRTPHAARRTPHAARRTPRARRGSRPTHHAPRTTHHAPRLAPRARCTTWQSTRMRPS